jgi:anti-sigma B factor antagonist
VAARDQLRIDVKPEGERTVVSLEGELDLASAPLLASELDGEQVGAANTVVLDLQELRFIDSTGLRAILAANERFRERGRTFAITRGSEQVERLLAITRVDEHLRVLASADELFV